MIHLDEKKIFGIALIELVRRSGRRPHSESKIFVHMPMRERRYIFPISSILSLRQFYE